MDIDDDDLSSFPRVQTVLKKSTTSLPLVALNDIPLMNGHIFFPSIVAELEGRGIKLKRATN
ncbi:MAG: hypothetical protein ACYC0N_00260 [Carboxydocellales bacterium]